LAILPLALFMLSVVKPVHVEGGASSGVRSTEGPILCW
jgi:hypothetical protein